MTEAEAHIAFNMIPDVGAVRLDRLVRDAGGSAVEAWNLFPEKKDWAGKTPAWERELEQAAKTHVTLLTRLDPAYPAALRDLASPPLVLYVVGDPAALSAPGVALVGTRDATPYGTETAGRFARGLARAGWSVISGLAAGIDAAAHTGALEGGGVTVGLLGGALDEFYPPENRALARRMVDNGGAVASEFPFGRKPDRRTFPQRNRLVAALARATLAIEAPLRSGTLITCARALELNRPVMAVPGRIDSKASAGALQLIREGARMVTSVEDVIEELTPLGRKTARPAAPASAAAAAPEAKFSPEEAAVLRALPPEGCAVDVLTRAVGLPAAKVNTILVGLRLKKRVRFLPGDRVVGV